MTSLYNLSPVAVFILIFLFDFLTLLVVAKKLKSVKILFENPAFFLGDFIVLPFAASLIFYYYQNLNFFPKELFLLQFNIINLILAFAISIWFGFHFRIIKNYWLPLYWWPHGIFHVVYVFIISSFVIISYLNKSFFILAVVLALVGLHLFLGKIFNKIFEIGRR